MGSSAKTIVENFYNSDFFRNREALEKYMHPDAVLSWYGSTGFKKLSRDEISSLGLEMSESFDSLRAEIEKVVEGKDEVAINFTYHVRTIENPDEEIPMAHFIAIWEVKDGKLYKGVQISQLGEEVEETPWD